MLYIYIYDDERAILKSKIKFPFCYVESCVIRRLSLFSCNKRYKPVQEHPKETMPFPCQ